MESPVHTDNPPVYTYLFRVHLYELPHIHQTLQSSHILDDATQMGYHLLTSYLVTLPDSHL